VGETTIFLVRHAQSLPLPDQPEPDWVLSAVGENQARGLAAILAGLGVRHAYTSPYVRCRQTLTPFAASAGIELLVHEGLRERRIAGRWLPDFRDVWRQSWADFSYALEGGESSWTCRARIAAALQEIAVRHAGETIAAASHGNAIGLFLHAVDASFGIEAASALRTPEIVKVVHAGGEFRWDKSFRAGDAFDALATDFRLTPGVIA
jgi:2,3-bisphosphoglycerate-dependent phosphoglycerate mutase